jgi:CRP-like cAMP-binding protein
MIAQFHSDISDTSKKLSNSNFLKKDQKELTGKKAQIENNAYEFLRSLREFTELPEADLKSLAQFSRFASYGPGQYISNEGEEEGSHGFIVVSGRVAMTKTSLSGKELIVELLQARDLFGLLFTLTAEKLPTQLSARSLQRTKVLRVPIKTFKQIIEKYPLLLEDFISHLLICLKSSYRLSRGLAHDRVDVRIASILSSLSLKFPERPNQKPTTIRFTRQQLADLTGTTPETAIRVTRDMHKQGVIDLKHPGVITLLDLNALHSLAEE